MFKPIMNQAKINLIPILSFTGNNPKFHCIPYISELIKLQFMMSYVQKYYLHLDIFKMPPTLDIFPIAKEAFFEDKCGHLRYISYCQKETFFEDKYGQKKNFRTLKTTLCFVS